MEQLTRNRKYNVDRIVSYAYGASWPSGIADIQVSQNPVIRKKLVTQGYLFLSKSEDPTKHLVVYLWGEGASIFYDPSKSENLVAAQQLLKELGEQEKDHSVYNGGVLELKETGLVGFLDGVENTHYGWESLILESELKANVQNTIDGFLKNYQYEEWKKFGLPLNRGVLLYGSPGTGKTLIGKIIATQVLNQVYPNTVTYIHTSARHLTYLETVRDIYNISRMLAPAVVFVEDIDLIAGRNRKFRQDVLNEFLQQLSGIEELNGVLTIASSNYGQDLDEALLRSKRLGFHFEIGLPKYNERVALWRLFTKSLAGADLRFEDYANLTEEMTGADIQELTLLAIEKMLREQLSDLKDSHVRWAFEFRKATRLKQRHLGGVQ